MTPVRSLSVLILCLALASTASAQKPGVPVTIVGDWTMQNNGSTVVEDFSGFNHHAQLIGDSNFLADPEMLHSIEITGVSGYMSVPHSAALEPARGGVETWIKPKDLLRDVDVFTKLTSKTLRSGHLGGKQVYGVHLFKDGSLAGYILNDALAGDRFWTWVWGPRLLITAGKWHHILLQWDGRHLTLFVNGAHVSRHAYKEIPGSGLSYSQGSELMFGRATRWFESTDHQFLGQFGATRVFHGALSDEQVRLRAILPR